MPSKSENLTGMFYMTLSMASFCLADLALKWACELLPTGQVMFILGLGCCALFWSIVSRKQEKVLTRVFFIPAVLLRTVGEAVAVIFIFLALINSAFTSVAAILQTLPLLMTLISFLFLGEKVGMRHLLAVVVGFAGVLLIIQPGADSFDVFSLYAVLAVIGLSMRDVGSHLSPSSISASMLALYGAMTFVVIGLVMMWFGGAKMPSLEAAGYLLAMILLASSGSYYTTKAMRLGEISVISPLRYTRLLFGMMVGVFILHEEVDQYMLLGSAIIVMAGLYVLFREQRYRVVH
ncbi:DMT family transporter [Candidatus Njordibacter sp. Uisw_039]|jgi:drug/metabolite transporter (DMT)-like permease|uniref:DMT family transporter n=1 Tax=Candidatus Njordibacter sp. Uisw_039 TaxID=3230972 RepID=UPI003A11D989|tara:strand:+ start:370 stop:1245 length:876 start_codon:yes stop_codon:yes gene_type:complete